MLKKVTQEKMHLFRSYKEHDNNLLINLTKDIEFNFIYLSNTKESNIIYTINELRLKGKANNKVTLVIDEDLFKEGSMTNNKSLNIDCKFVNDKISSGIELSTLQISSESTSDILQKDYIIMLPNGNLIIKFETPIKEMELELNYSLEYL